MIDKRYIVIFIVFIICIVGSWTHSIIWIFTVILMYGIGRLWGDKLLQYIEINVQLNKSCIDKLITDNLCQICSGDNCKRHRQSIHNTHVKVPKDFDVALQNLLEKILQSYVCSWYSNISNDDAFLHQLRLIITTGVRNIIARIMRTNVSDVIFNNLIPILLKHAEDYKILCEHVKNKGGKPEDYALDYLGHKVHPAAYSRQAELAYLRGLITGVLPHVLPNINISINNMIILREIMTNWVLLPAMDALADPDSINFLVKLSTQYEGVLFQEMDSIDVPVLQTWITPVIRIQNSDHPLKPSLEQVLNDPQLLYLFMQHIKETGPVKLLQFCLDIDDLSKRMLNPEMTKEIEENLYTDACNIYSTYLDPESNEYLYLPWHISQGMKEILNNGPDKIQELRTSRPLYQAHQEAHAMLEAVCLPSFHHSYELYKLLCGEAASSNCTKFSTQSGGSSGAGVGSRLSNQLGKIRGVLRTSTVDGATFPTPDVYQAEEVERNDSDIPLYGDKSSRDLSTWRVSIPHVDGGGSFPLYMVAIHSVSEDKSWTVLRRDQDFYNLRTRLLEFHGDREMNDSPLPTRKNQQVLLTANRQRYQDFLQKLLTKPTLKCSELLYTFLTAPNFKPYLNNYTTPDIGVLYQSVAHKLRKEKGQNLDKFMNTLLASTNIEHEHINVGVDLIDENNDIINVKKGKFKIIIGPPFYNNLNIIDDDDKNIPYIPAKKYHIKGACFCIAEAVENLSDVSPLISRITWLIASLFRSNVDPLCNKLLNQTLSKLLSAGRAAMVIKSLHNIMFSPLKGGKIPATTPKERYESAKKGLYALLPWWFFGVHTNYWNKLMDSLLEPLQNAPLNKHLAYTLVDQILAITFPELLQIR